MNQKQFVKKTKFSFEKWCHGMSFKITICQIGFMLLMISATVIIMMTLERSALRQKSYDFIEQMGDKIISDLDEQISMAESLTTSLANIGECIEPNERIYKEVIPHVMNYEGYEELIAGGGLWPEPYAFYPQVVRRSFFWGRDKAGHLNYYDEYNDPNGAGYHNEEWYVPASVYPGKKAFWSKSYMDPHSYQPMVTCTVPMYKEERFIGVTTIDLKLEGLRSFFEEEARLIGGYIFAVDRNNKFLSFPKEELVKTYTPDERGKIVEEFVHVNELARKDPRFQPFSSALEDINVEIVKEAQKDEAFNSDLAEHIDSHSYQVDAREALLIASVMCNPLKIPVWQSNELKQLFLKDDLLLNQPVVVSIFHMPKTYWKIVTVSPISIANREADLITAKVALFILVSECLLLCVMFVFMVRLLVRPIRKMSKDLADMSNNPENLSNRLNVSSKDELGDLACQFNRRTDWLVSALENLQKTTTSIENLNKEIAERERAEKALEASNHYLEQAVSKLEEANSELKDFVYVASHDLREPLRKITSFGGLLRDSLKDKLGSDDKENLEFMIDGANRMTTMIEGLLLYSRVSTKGGEFGEVDLNEVVEQLEQLELAKLLEETGGTIEVPQPLPKVEGDAVQISQLLQNLIANGIKYHREEVKPQIVLTAQDVEDGNKVRIGVKDNGIGIEEKYHEDVFRMFRRLHSREKYAGSGIGLAVCKRIVERHDGQIGVESNCDEGTTFWFTLSPVNEAVAVS